MQTINYLNVNLVQWEEDDLPEINLSAEDLPLKILSFDIETSHTSFRHPEKSTLAIAGALEFNLIKSKLTYRKGKYRYFLENQMQELSDFLNQFDGIIIGHNLLGFDYRVLEQHIDLKTVIPKTIDTLALVYNKHSHQRGGISLNNLAQENFGKEKTIKGENISAMWNAGQHKEIIEYNENDCVLTKNLWWFMVKNGKIKTSPRYFGGEPIFFNDKDYPVLLGKMPNLNFEQWKVHITEHGSGVFKKRKILISRINEAGLAIDERAIFHNLRCKSCAHDFLLATPIGFSLTLDTPVNCPNCLSIANVGKADIHNVEKVHVYKGAVYESNTTFKLQLPNRFPAQFPNYIAITSDKATKLALRRRTWRPY
jgi:DNA polymerase III epsilon subunit-like protein